MPETIVLGGGCFWCTEAIFRRLPGVLSAMPGYAGGHLERPTYDDVCGGATGHAEVAQVTFEPEKISLESILAVFFAMHDPTTMNRQGNDKGPQYRSVILWTTDEQRKTAEQVLRTIAGQFDEPIVTEVKPLDAFYPAEVDHQQYYDKNPAAPYCSFVIAPKLEKLQKLLAQPLA